MGIALPKWIVESGNNIWVLGVYGAIFGGALPAMVVCTHYIIRLHLEVNPCAGPLVVRKQTEDERRRGRTQCSHVL